MAAATEVITGEDEYVEMDLSRDDVVNKYRQAADITNAAIQGVLTRCIPGADVLELCTLGDKLVQVQCNKAFKSKKVPKGLAFPTCISVNNIVGHNSPLDAEGSSTLAEGDVVKVDIGTQLDGFIAVAAHTGIVGTDGALATEPLMNEEETKAALDAEIPAEAEAAAASTDASAAAADVSADKKADVTTAAYVCAELALRLVKPGNTNTEVTKAFDRVAKHFGVNLCQGVISHELKQFVIDGSKCILSREVKEEDQVVDEVTFGPNEVYAIDVVVSSGEGKPKEADVRTTVFKRDVERMYGLKMEASRWLMRQVQEQFPTIPFSLRSFDDARQARVGISECVKHDLVHSYPVLKEKDGELVAQFKYTAMLLKSGTLKATGLSLPAGMRSSKFDTLPADLKKILATPSFISKNKKKKKTNKKKAAAKSE